MAKVKRDLGYLGFETEVSWNESKIVQVAWIRIKGILMEAKIVGRAEQKLSVKIEIDTRPPGGARTETRLLDRGMIFALRHYDLPSLMAGKVHALLARPYAKGRDWYDLLWYRTRRPPTEPNEILLKAALLQTGTEMEGSWKDGIRHRAAKLDFVAIRSDVEPFLERREDAELLTEEGLAGLLG
jgi:hypothetical protein